MVTITVKQEAFFKVFLTCYNNVDFRSIVTSALNIHSTSSTAYVKRLMKAGLIEKKGHQYFPVNIPYEVVEVNKTNRPKKEDKAVATTPLNPTHVFKEGKKITIVEPIKLFPLEYCNGKLVRMPLPKYANS
jgi:hypothetical protein